MQPHIQLEENLGIKYAILPGDPARVDRIASHLEDVEELGFNREYKSIKGNYKGVPVLAMSTGMGGPSVGIAIEELKNIGVTHCIRIGSCGALREDIRLGDLILVNGAVRDDGTSKYYVEAGYPAIPDTGLLMACAECAAKRGVNYHVGIIRSHDGFYMDDQDKLNDYWSKRDVLASDMETATLFTLGRLRGLKTASILNNLVVWGEDTFSAIGSYADGESLTAAGEREEILLALEVFVKNEKNLN